MNWSNEQNAIFNWFENGTGNLVVRARAGTGKTTTIKEAFGKAPESTMLYAVFNKKNQREASEKISDGRVEVLTLHSVGFRAILRVWHGSKPDGEVEWDRMRDICGTSVPDDVAGQIIKLVGFLKNLFCGVPSLTEAIQVAESKDICAEGFESEWPMHAIAECAIGCLELSKSRDPQKRISFDDMVWLPVAMNWTRKIYDLVCVDEAQDMNVPQLIMAKNSVKDGGRVCVVGDDRQAIYGFRGAHQNGMEMMREELKAQVLGLTVTYRCPKLVVAEANKFVQDYTAHESAPDGIVENSSISKFAPQIGDTVLSRANAPLMPLCLSMLRKGIPARIEGKDIGRMLIAIVRGLKARSVPDFIERVESWRNKQITRALKKKRGSESKCELINDQADTLLAISEGLTGVREIENRIASLFEDSANSFKPCVLFSTVHKAKGLEFPKVFILRDTFMHPGRPVSREEENIFYVAVTRAKHHLVFLRNDVREEEVDKREVCA